MKILAFGEVMMRLNPSNYKKLIQTNQLDFSFTGTGLNILAGLSVNGYETSILTALPDNNLGRTASANIRKLGVRESHVQYSGQHMGTYLLELGFGKRPSEVTYLNRAHSSYNQFVFTDKMIETSLEGVKFVHVCGIALSTSECSRKNALRVAELANKKGIKVCFDFNFRSSLNEKAERERLIKAYKKILSNCSIVFGSLRDLTDLLAIKGANPEEIVHKFMSDYKLEIFAGTKRTTKDNQKYLSGYLYHHKEMVVSDAFSYQVLDRIGTGDAFVSGILTGLIEEWDLKTTINFATVSGALAHTTIGDSPLLDKAFILSQMSSEQEVIR